MKKFLLLFILSFSILGCTPASKEKLKETRSDLLELAKAHKNLAESHAVLAAVTSHYGQYPESVKKALLDDARNRVSESTSIETKTEKHSKEEVGIFSKSFGEILVQFWDVTKPFLENTVKAVVDAGSSQGGIVSTITSVLLLAYGVYQQVSKSKIIAKVKEEKAEEKEIEHEADKLIPAERHAEWEEAEKKARIKVVAKKKGLV